MSAADWKARTNDPALVDDIVQTVHAATAALDREDAAAATDGISHLRAMRSSLRSDEVGADDEDVRDQLETKIALIESCVAALEAIAAPDASGVGAYIDDLADGMSWIEASTLGARASVELSAAGAEAEQSAAQIADQIMGLEPETRRVVFAAAVSPGGFAIVFEKIAVDWRPAIAAEIAVASAANPDYRDSLCSAAVANAAAVAAEPADALAPDNAASTLLAAFAAVPAMSAYASQVAAASPADIHSLAATLAGLAVPSAVSRIVAAVHLALDERFGSATATDLVRGCLLLRMIGPSLPTDLTTQVEVFLGETPGGEDIATDDALTVFTGHVVAAGAQAAELAAAGNDPDDIVTMRGNALLGADELAATFMTPTPPDPLGTLPANPATILGQAILKARGARPGGYEWAAVLDLQLRDIDLYLALIEDERIAVMDLIEIPGGVRTDAAVAEAA